MANHFAKGRPTIEMLGDEPPEEVPAEKPKRGRGRPKGSKSMKQHKQSKFDRKKKWQFLRELEKLGGNRNASCGRVGISYATFLDHYKKDEAFAQRVDEALDRASANVEEAITDRAINGVDKPLLYKGEIVAYEKQYSDTLLMERARALMPERYSKKVQVDQNVSVEEGAKAKLSALLGIETSPGTYEVDPSS